VTLPRESPPADPALATLRALNAAARRRGAVTETLHGVEVPDPYRALERDDAETRAWIDAQTDHARAALAGAADPERRARLERLLSIGALGGVAVCGDRVFFTRRDGGREQPALYVLDGVRASAAPAAVAGRGASAPREARLLVDPVASGERTALDWWYASPHGKYVAYGLSTNGDERSTLHVVDVATGRVLERDRIPRTKWSNVSWLGDERGFYYTRYPAPGEPGYDAAHEDTYFPRVFFHRLGDDPARDALVYGGERNTDFPAPRVSDDDRWVVLNVFRGWSRSDVLLIDRRARVAPGGLPTPIPVVEGHEAISSGRVHEGKLYLLTNLDAPRYRLMVADRPDRAADASRWRTVIAESADPIERYTFAGGRLLVERSQRVAARLDSYRLDGTDAREIALPVRGSIGDLDADSGAPLVALTFESFFYPPTLLALDVRTGSLRELTRVQADVDTSAYELRQESVRSADGTEVPVWVAAPRGLPRDGSARVLLYGYGGFNVSLTPTFTRHALYWLSRGGVFAVANLRGGGEFGEEWHRAGNLENKPRVFEDFEAVLRWLSSSGISRPERIAITGGSNGGLLMGAMITRCPDAFAAAATYVGLYDMVRYHRFPPAELWVTEYGSSDDPAQFRTLLGYSPYHRVRAGTPYPAVLVETADHDSRVSWIHSTKFAAALQDATSSDRPILFYRETAVGHGAGTRLSDLVSRYERMYAFFEQHLGR
jgi:prolyl oligopeptidase